jgi:hypothetical protein
MNSLLSSFDENHHHFFEEVFENNQNSFVLGRTKTNRFPIPK